MNLSPAENKTITDALIGLTTYADAGANGWRLLLEAAGLREFVPGLNLSGPPQLAAQGIVSKLAGQEKVPDMPGYRPLGALLAVMEGMATELSNSTRAELAKLIIKRQMVDDPPYLAGLRARHQLPDIKQLVPPPKDQAGKAADHQAGDRRARFESALVRLQSLVKDRNLKIPECYISYAWGDPEHEHWVEKSLATDLLKAGFRVPLDKWKLKTGSSYARFVELVADCDYVLVVGTPAYRQKAKNIIADNKGGVLAAQWDLASIRMIATEEAKMTVLPLLRSGDESEAFPASLQGRVYADFRDDAQYFESALKLFLQLYDIPHNDPLAAELVRSLNDSTT